MSLSPLSLEQILEKHLQTLALTLRSGTMDQYRSTVRGFLAYLRGAFPRVRRTSQLRRDPHLLGWFRSLCGQQPPLHVTTRAAHLILLRRLLDDLAAQHPSLQPALIRREDIPRQPRGLPRPLSAHDDALLQQELRRIDDLKANALLLIRATGVRLGECIHLSLDCLREIGPGQWALLVPLGKLHTERLVPADPEVRRIVARILTLRALAPPFQLARAQGFLLPRWGGPHTLYHPLGLALAQAARRAGCSTHVTPHRLRHSFATEMLRLGVSLPALMQLLGHTALGMTLRYVQVTQQDLQREFHEARQKAARTHRLPTLPLPSGITRADPLGIHQALTATRHLLEMYRRQTPDPKMKRRLQRLDRRLLAVASQLDRITIVEK